LVLLLGSQIHHLDFTLWILFSSCRKRYGKEGKESCILSPPSPLPALAGLSRKRRNHSGLASFSSAVDVLREKKAFGPK
jgi:hypothetical protein